MPLKATLITTPMDKGVKPGVESMSSEGAIGGGIVIAEVLHATMRKDEEEVEEWGRTRVGGGGEEGLGEQQGRW